MKNLRTLIFFASIAMLSSCSEDESTPDFIGESVGTYSYSGRVFDSNNAVAGNTTGSITLSRNGDDITMIIDDDETIKTSRVEIASNGYGFDIESATLVDPDGDLVDRNGQTSSTVDGKSYHGRYDSGSKQIFMNVSYTYQDTQWSDFNVLIEVTATKN